jgi:hypothetical protein
MSLLTFLDFLNDHADIFKLRASIPTLKANVAKHEIELKEHQERCSKEPGEENEYVMNSFVTRLLNPLKKQLDDAKEKCTAELQERLLALGKAAEVSDEHIEKILEGKGQFVINYLMIHKK